MRVPFIWIAILFSVGICLGRNVPTLVLGLFGLALGLAGVGLASGRLRRVALASLLVVSGWLDYTCCTGEFSPHDLRILVGSGPEEAIVTGVLEEAPTVREVRIGKRMRLHTTVPIRLNYLQRGGRLERALGTVMASVPGALDPKWSRGQTVEVAGILEIPRRAAAEGLFDYRNYLETMGIYYGLAASSVDDFQLVGPRTAAGWCDRFSSWAQRTLAKGLPGEDEPLRLLWAMTLGWKPALTGEVSAPFMETGTLHVFAISGLHIALLAGILVRLLRVAQIPRSVCGLVALPLLWFYTFATGFQASAVRSTVMMSVIIAGWAVARPSDLVNSLAAAAFIITCWDPRQLFQAGFQLSFAVVLSLAVLGSAFEKARARLFERDPLRLPEPPGTGGWRTLVRWLQTSIVTSLAAWVGSLPLIAYYFHMVTPVSLAANLVIVPLSSVALMSSLGSLLCGDWLAWAAELFNFSSWFWMWCMVKLSEAMARWPAAFYYVSSPSLSWMAVYYAALLALFWSWVRARRRRIAIASVIMTGAAAVILTGWKWPEKRMTITVLPDSGTIFVEEPSQRRNLLIDCGNERSAEMLLKPFLQARGINCIRQLVLTHGDINHVGGFETLCKHFTIGDVNTSRARFRSAVYGRLIKILEQGKHRWKRLDRGDEIGNWTVLHPDTLDPVARADDEALVLEYRIGATRVLLLSELGPAGQRLLAGRTDDLHSELVVAGAAGQEERMSAFLLERVRPEVVIWTSARAGPGGKKKVLAERLRALGIRFFSTRDCGAVTVRIGSKGSEVQTAWREED